MIKNIPIRNKELIKTLNKIEKLHTMEGFTNNVRLVGDSTKHKRDYYVSDEYKDLIINKGDHHEGYPETFYGYDYKIHDPRHATFLTNSDKVWCVDFMKKVSALNQELMESLCTRGNALSVAYPPGGFIAWHNNANACAFNLIFTWSETGEGYFKYVDPETKQVVNIKDEPGWQCKAGYFGSYKEPDKLLYHVASTDCWRITWSYIFDHYDQSEFAQNDIIEEISTE